MNKRKGNPYFTPRLPDRYRARGYGSDMKRKAQRALKFGEGAQKTNPNDVRKDNVMVPNRQPPASSSSASSVVAQEPELNNVPKPQRKESDQDDATDAMPISESRPNTEYIPDDWSPISTTWTPTEDTSNEF